jgi:hypothetical protein
MSLQDDSANAKSLKYATTFDEKLLGVGCDVDVTVSLVTGDAVAAVSMRPLLRSSPAFQISLDNLKAIAAAVESAKTNFKLLESKVDGAEDHQLQYHYGGASLTVAKPTQKPAKAVLTIGSFSRESDLEKLSIEEISKAVSTCEELISKVKQKVLRAKK